MTLEEYIERVKVENNIPYTTKEIKDHIVSKARKKLDNKSGGIDDETVKQWILEYKPKGEDKATEKPKIEKPAGITEKKEEEWGEQQSLF